MNLAGSLAAKPLSTAAKAACKSLAVVFSRETDIYFNLSLENYLLSTFGSGSQSRFGPSSPVVYLWRNSPCVIVGRNQNVWSECNLENIKDDVNIVRRFTGGGAVYQVGRADAQDLGNTCFTFISDAANYDFRRNSELICAAMGKLIGTLLININKGSLEKYLTPEKSKLAVGPGNPQKHNVKSVEARVTNLAQFKPGITHEQVGAPHAQVCDAIVREAMARFGVAAKEVGAPQPQVLEVDRGSELCRERAFADCYSKLTVGAADAQDRAWIFGKKPTDPRTFKHRFEFGSVEFCLDVKAGRVENVCIYSDMLNADLVDHLNAVFNRGPFALTREAFARKFDECGRRARRAELPGCEEPVRAIRAWVTQQLPESRD